ncbi:MAG: energy-coupling factor transporter transmembrane protein EcfT [Xanthobacteraceae bacterium]|nr:MAG: energy-coupling factor transporter transmembrane protein EcfT [Xanthobacteraceae bacterium]
MITTYLARRTWLHGVPAGVKLFALAALSFMLLPVQDWRILATAAMLAALVFAALGREARQRLALIRPLLPVLAIIAAFQVMTGDWRDAVGAVARLTLMVMLAELVTMTTTMAAMMEALAPVLRPLRHLGLDPRALTLAVALVIRFVPVLLEAWQRRAEAWRARSGRRPALRLVAPFVAEALRLADHVAEALTARGFAASARPQEHPMRKIP